MLYVVVYLNGENRGAVERAVIFYSCSLSGLYCVIYNIAHLEPLLVPGMTNAMIDAEAMSL